MNAPKAKQQPPSITEPTRRDIFLEIESCWSGRLSDVDFLARIYDLENMPSTDGRFLNAAGDIYQHRINNSDWDEGWVLTDFRFGLLRGDDEVFLKFLCETVHPSVRPDIEQGKKLVSIFNDWLYTDGWKIVAKRKISNRPLYEAERVGAPIPALEAVMRPKGILQEEYVRRQIERIEGSVTSDPDLAIGTAKEFVETICKTILQDTGETVSGTVDLTRLVKQTCRKLHLLPDDIPEAAKGAETIKKILSNLAMISQGVAEIRNLYGSGHGKHAKHVGVGSRHAKLVVGASTTLAIFLFETFQEQRG